MALNIESILLKEERKEYNQEYLNNTAGKTNTIYNIYII